MQIENVINSEYLDDTQNKRIVCPSCSQNRKKEKRKDFISNKRWG